MSSRDTELIGRVLDYLLALFITGYVVVMLTSNGHPLILKIPLALALLMMAASSVSQKVRRWMLGPFARPETNTPSDSGESKNH